jgi:predicted RNA binding protein YcfA (HicA-like mRNA interferase family)
MPAGYARDVIAILEAHGCTLVRHGKGDHDIWQSPISNTRFVVDGKILSRHLANAVLKQAGIKAKIG